MVQLYYIKRVIPKNFFFLVYVTSIFVSIQFSFLRLIFFNRMTHVRVTFKNYVCDLVRFNIIVKIVKIVKIYTNSFVKLLYS
jgi:hypothetical protein